MNDTDRQQSASTSDERVLHAGAVVLEPVDRMARNVSRGKVFNVSTLRDFVTWIVGQICNHSLE